MDAHDRTLREARKNYARMLRINRIGKRTLIAMCIIACVAIAYWLLR